MSFNPDNVEHRFGIGAMCPELVSGLVKRDVPVVPVRIPFYQLRVLPSTQMSQQEHDIMLGGSRFVAVPDSREYDGIRGWHYLLDKDTEVPFFEDYDNTDPERYFPREAYGHTADKDVKRGILIARKRIGKIGFKVEDAVYYDPYALYPGDQDERRRLALASIPDARAYTISQKPELARIQI